MRGRKRHRKKGAKKKRREWVEWVEFSASDRAAYSIEEYSIGAELPWPTLRYRVWYNRWGELCQSIEREDPLPTKDDYPATEKLTT